VFESPVIRAVGDAGLQIDFADSFSDAAHEQVLALDNTVNQIKPSGLVETIPSYVSLLVIYNPLETSYARLASSIEKLLAYPEVVEHNATQWTVPVCYDDEFGFDLAEVCTLTGLSAQEVTAAHEQSVYKVYMYGFAPGYAYLGGVPESIRLSRKTQAVRDIPKGSVMIATEQCLVTTLKMPTGWWVIGRSPARILQPESDNPFPVQVGDTVSFQAVNRAEFDDLLDHDPSGGLTC
jgi:inhibitor of KinA